jgi:sialidase-1
MNHITKSILLCTALVTSAEIAFSPISNPVRIDRSATPIGHFAISPNGRITGFEVDAQGAELRIEAQGRLVAEGAGPRLLADFALQGKQTFELSCRLPTDQVLTQRLRFRLLAVEIGGKTVPVTTPETAVWHPAVKVRDSGDDGSKGHRIPALIKTTKGTLIAAYDARYTGMRDLQGHIDIALNRSSDGGRTWGPRIIALDMGEYGGLPEAYNGVSDAALIVDERSGRLFCFGLWMHGVNDSNGKWIGAEGWTHQWRKNGSMPGFALKGSSQFLMSTSDDDGLTWSTPANITRMVKRDPAWRLYAPAPGNGITLRDGTLVVPTQGLDGESRQFSTVMVSKDRGVTWRTGLPANDITAGARANECAVVQLGDGSLMLNSRDPSRTKKRGVYISRDLGETWTPHATDHQALIEPTCMASLIRHGEFLLFSNPHSSKSRSHMTVQLSVDEGMSWPHKLLLDQNGGAYSCLTSIDADTIGILYESSQAQLLFQAIPIAAIRK